MMIPSVCGTIDRRLLINFRVEPSILAKVLPEPFKPQIIGGYGIAGICLIRLTKIRPVGFPSLLGVSSENAAHRIAVTWQQSGKAKTGVYIPRRDTSSRLNAFAGGTLFGAVHHLAQFDVHETDRRYRVSMKSETGSAGLSIDASMVSEFPEESVFETLEQASEFFRQGSLGYSPSATPGRFDALELQSSDWRVHPLAVRHVQSSWLHSTSDFTDTACAFDSALLMRGIRHSWHSRQPMCREQVCSASTV